MFGDQQSLPVQVALNPRFQFSLRGMLWLTLATCISLTIASLCRGSEYFGAVASPWTWGTLAIIAASWIISRRRERRRWVLGSSAILYGISLAVPALTFSDNEMWFGFQLWMTSAQGSWEYVRDWIYPPSPPTWLNISLGGCMAAAIFCGLLANVAAVSSWVACYVARRTQKHAVLARWLPWGWFAATLICVVLLSCAIRMPVLLPGYGFWAASALSLALRS